MAPIPDTSFTIGVDLGGTNLRIGAYTRPGGLVETIPLPTRLKSGPEVVVSDMCNAIRLLHDRLQIPGKARDAVLERRRFVVKDVVEEACDDDASAGFEASVADPRDFGGAHHHRAAEKR